MAAVLLLTSSGCHRSIASTEENRRTGQYAIVIHGGAGTIEKKNMDVQTEKAYKEALHRALNAGEEILQAGGKSIEAVEAAICIMEDSPLFNAGKGAVFTHEGKNELDASIMCGDTKMAGAAGSVTVVKNPIRLARAIMEKSEHVMMIGAGAEVTGKMADLSVSDYSQVIV